MFRGSSVRENLDEGMKNLNKVPAEEMKDADVLDVIDFGKRQRKGKSEKKQLQKESAIKIQKAAKNMQARIVAKEEARTRDFARAKEEEQELGKQLDRQKFMARNGIYDYAEKGQRTKERKRQEKQEVEEKRNKNALAIQKVFRGAQSRSKPENSPYDIERVKRFVKPNPDYDPAITDQTDKRSHRELYYKPNILTTTERKAIEYDQSQSRIKKRIEERMEERQRKRQGERLIETKRNLQDKLADFIDQDERPLHQRLSAAYGKK